MAEIEVVALCLPCRSVPRRGSHTPTASATASAASGRACQGSEHAPNGRGASAPPGPSSPGALHTHSVGALTSRAAFPVTASAFAIACMRSRGRSGHHLRFARMGALVPMVGALSRLPHCESDGLELAGKRELTRADGVPMQRVQRVRHSGASVGHRSEHLADITWDANVRATAGAECRKRIRLRESELGLSLASVPPAPGGLVRMSASLLSTPRGCRPGLRLGWSARSARSRAHG